MHRTLKSSPRHRMLYRHSLSLFSFYVDTLHLLTRHPQRIPSKGYSGPLTGSSFLVFFILTVLIYLLMLWAGYKVDITNITPLFCMFHFEDHNSATSNSTNTFLIIH